MNITYLPRSGLRLSGNEFAQTPTLSRLKDFLQRSIYAFRKHRELRKARRIDRLAFQHVMHLNDHMLEDIGVTRYDVLWANKLPLTKNAALELRNIARKRRRAIQP